MERKKTWVLGGGISGLTLAYYLSKDPSRSVSLFEKQATLGGWVRQKNLLDSPINTGPRTLRPSVSTLTLLDELGLLTKTIIPSPELSKRYLYCKTALHSAQLHEVPDRWWKIFSSPLFQGLKGSLFQALLPRKALKNDISLDGLIKQRFGSNFYDRLVTPLCLGIFGRNPEGLSLECGFPSLFASLSTPVSRRFLKKNPQPKPPEGWNKYLTSSLITLPGGLSLLIEKLQHACAQQGVEFCLQEVLTQEKLEQSDAEEIFIAVGGNALFSLFPEAEELRIEHTSVATLHLLLSPLCAKKLPLGFGYLIPETENQDILGVLFDGYLHPHPQGFPLSLMLPYHAAMESERILVKKGMERLEKQLGISIEMLAHRVSVAKDAIPFYPVGFQERRDVFLEKMAREKPRYRFAGTLFSGVGLNDAMRYSSLLAKKALGQKS